MAALDSNYHFPDTETIKRTLLAHPSFKTGWPKPETVEAIVALAAKHFAKQEWDEERIPMEVGHIIYDIQKGPNLQQGIDKALSTQIFSAHLPESYFSALQMVLPTALTKCAKEFMAKRESNSST